MLCNYDRNSYHLTRNHCSSRGRPLVLFCVAVQLHPDRGRGKQAFWQNEGGFQTLEFSCGWTFAFGGSRWAKCSGSKGLKSDWSRKLGSMGFKLQRCWCCVMAHKSTGEDMGRWTLVLVGPEFIFKSMSANKGKLVFDGRKNFNQVLRYDIIVQVRDCHKEQNRARHSSCFYIHALMHK